MKKIKILIFTIFISLLFVPAIKAADFNCTVDGYTLTYNDSGKLIAAKSKDGKQVDKNLESYYHPTNKSDCPTASISQIDRIDGGRTLYVAKKGETYTSNSGSATNDAGVGCTDYSNRGDCISSDSFACIWNETEYGNYCNVDNLLYVKCGDAFDIPNQVPKIISFVVNALKIMTPIILIIVSMITLFKAIAASKDDEIKKAQSSLVRKIVAAVMVFFVISIVQFVIMKVADSSEKDNISKCLTCFLNNDCDGSVYYKSNIGGTYTCKYVNGGTFTCGENN